MFCGFGAVVLLVLIINSNTISQRREKNQVLRTEVERLEIEQTVAQEGLENLLTRLAKLQGSISAMRDQQNKISAAITAEQGALAESSVQQEQEQKTIAALKKELQSLERQKENLQAQVDQQKEVESKARQFEGEGNRQYLTGLKLGGNRVLILLDSSASMLDRKVVNIIRRRVMDDQSKLTAPKWQRAVRSVKWILANLPLQSKVQVLSFNTQVKKLGLANDPFWLPIADSSKIDGIVDTLSKVIPRDGTSLEKCFRYIKTITPAPDNIILITDGLPTQGLKRPSQSTVSGKERVRFFERSMQQLPPNVPVNTILFPMEGDPMAALLFWQVAVKTSGSFFTPTRDWP